MRLLPSDTQNFLYPVTLIRVETGGVLKLLLANHQTVEIPVHSGALVNLPVKRIFATGTTASGFHNNLLSPADTDAEVPYGPAASPPPPPAAPAFVSITLQPNGRDVVIVFDRNVAVQPDGYIGALTLVAYGEYGLTVVSATGPAVTATINEFADPLHLGVTGTWSYTSTEFGVVGDPDGVPAASVTDATLVNHSEVPVPVPELQVALLFTDPPELLLLFSRSTTASDATGLTLADDNAPSYALAYSRNDGSGPIFTVTGVTGGTAVNPRLSYAGGGTLVGVEGGVVAAFTDQAVNPA